MLIKIAYPRAEAILTPWFRWVSRHDEGLFLPDFLSRFVYTHSLPLYFHPAFGAFIDPHSERDIHFFPAR